MRNFSEIKYLVKFNKWLYIVPIVLCPLIAMIIIIFSEPVFVSTAKLWTKEKQDESMLLKIFRQGIQEETYIKVQKEIILSYRVFEGVVNKLNLLVPPPSQSIFNKLIGRTKNNGVVQNPELALIDAVDSLKKSVSVDILNPEILLIIIKTNSAKLSQQVCEVIVQEYKDSYLSILNKEVEVYESFLNNWLTQLKDDLDRKTYDLIQFENDHPELRRDLISSEGPQVPLKPELLSPTYAKTIADSSPIPAIMNRIGVLKLDLNKLKTTSSEKSFEIEKLNKEIVADQLLLDFYTRYLTEQAVLLIQRELLNWNQTEAEKRYISVRQEFDKIFLSRGGKLQQTTSITVLDSPSYYEKPLFPRKRTTIFVSLVMGFFVSGAILYLKLLFDKAIYFPRDLDEIADARVLTIYKT